MLLNVAKDYLDETRHYLRSHRAYWHHQMLKFVKTGSDRIGVEETDWVSLLRA